VLGLALLRRLRWPFSGIVASIAKDAGTLRNALQYLPVRPTFENYVDAWTSPVTPFAGFFLNSPLCVSVTMVLTTLVSVLAVAIARFRFAGKYRLLLTFLPPRCFRRAAVAPLLTQWRALRACRYLPALISDFFRSGAVPSGDGRLFQLDTALPRERRDIDGGCNHFKRLPAIVLARGARHSLLHADFRFVVSYELCSRSRSDTDQHAHSVSGLLYMVGHTVH